MRALFTLLLAFLLTLSQASVRVHAVEHFSDANHDDSTPVCELCLAQAQSAWATPATQPPDAATPARFAIPAHLLLNQTGAYPALAYHSRAPPA